MMAAAGHVAAAQRWFMWGIVGGVIVGGAVGVVAYVVAPSFPRVVGAAPRASFALASAVVAGMTIWVIAVSAVAVHLEALNR